MSTPPLFLLSGPPGAGKSTTAVALARRFTRGLRIPVDDLREWVVSGIAHPVPEWTEETGRQFRLARMAAVRTSRLYLEAGFAVVIDDVLFPADVPNLFQEELPGWTVHKVVLLPPVEVALRRSAERTGKWFDPAVLEATIRNIHQAMEKAPFAEDGWIVLENVLGVEEVVDEILRRALIRDPDRA